MRRALCGLLVCLSVACGPVEYMSQVTRRASSAVEAARAANAETLAPYEFTSAVQYLHKAREEASAAQFQPALKFGRKAEEMAERARQRAIERAREPDARLGGSAPP